MKKLALLIAAALLLAGCTPKIVPEIHSVGASEVNLPAEASSGTTTFSTNCAWDASIDGAWAEIKPISGPASDNAQITVTATANPDPSPRSATITIIAEGEILRIKVTQAAKEPDPEIPEEKPGPQMVDLGLSVLWSDRNIGADAPEAYGDYYAWGETETKEAYSFNNCKWFNGGTENLTKYITHEKNGVVDNNLHMDPEDDVAYISLGEKWRTPTEAEFKELLDRCSWEWIGDSENKGGYKVTGPNGNSIYLPSAGGKGLTEAGYTGFYWAANILVSVPNNCSQLLTDPGSAVMSTLVRFFGCSVRPVYGDIVRVVGVSLDSDSETINQGETLQLSANIAPQNAFEKGILWTSSDESVATVGNNYDNYGLVTAVGEGTATITATTVDGGYKESCIVTVEASFEFAAVDLGLSVKWANANLGAAAPEEFGNYYAWGATAPQESYFWTECPFRISGSDWDFMKFSKYVAMAGYGDIDNKLTLEADDDAASVTLGGKWRMPTKDDFKELISEDNSSVEWTTVGSVNGLKITSKKTGRSIFLPAAGYYWKTDLSYVNDYGYYWSSNLCTNDYTSFSECLNFGVGGVDQWASHQGRCQGMPIRAVWDDTPAKTTIYLYDGNSWGNIYLYLWQGYNSGPYPWPGLSPEGTEVFNNHTFFKFCFSDTFDESMRMGMIASSSSDNQTYDQYCNEMKMGGTYFFKVEGNYIIQIDPESFNP